MKYCFLKHTINQAMTICVLTDLIHFIEQILIYLELIHKLLIKYHKKAIREMGLDMSNLDDYFTFVERLKRENPNYGAWKESKGCWESRIGSV